MKRPLKPDEARLWTIVASTVRPAPGKSISHLAPDAGNAKQSPLIPATRTEAQANAGTQPGQPQRSAKQQHQAHLGPRRGLSSGSATPRPGGGDERLREPIRKISQSPSAPHPIEPLRKRRIARERDPIEARLDLHGLDQDRARVVLHSFLQRAHANGYRAVLVITGKGALGDGVLRRRTPDWLAEPAVRPLIAGFSPAERRHGGEGAFYIALKRRQP